MPLYIIFFNDFEKRHVYKNFPSILHKRLASDIILNMLPCVYNDLRGLLSGVKLK